MKNKKNVVFGLIAMFIFTFGVVNIADANTYQFINTSGQLTSITAGTSGEALRTAYNLGLHSGVILVDTNNQNATGQGLYLYQFINTSGQLTSITANSPEEALRTAYQRGIHSGVVLVE